MCHVVATPPLCKPSPSPGPVVCGPALLSEEVMAHFKQLSRVTHFCLTPLLFLPRWRYDAHATRLKCETVTSERKDQVGDEERCRRAGWKEKAKSQASYTFKDLLMKKDLYLLS